jgi:hypothetical protein
MLTPSQIATLGNINERPGRLSVVAVGFDYAAALQSAGYITIKGGKCYPTAAAAPFKGRSPAQVRADMVEARATLIGRWSSL